MPYTVYIIFSEKWNQYYVGTTHDFAVRIEQHNNGRNTSTRGGSPWQLKYSEVFEDQKAAVQRELEIKKKKSRKYVEWLIAGTEV